jgi:acid-sensing ion channel, other
VFENVFREIFEGSKVHGKNVNESKYFESLLHICSSQLLKMIKIHKSVLNVDKELIDIFRDISYSIEDSMLFCKWRNVITECKEIFTQILTDQGFCFTFNLLKYQEVFSEDKIHKDFDYVQERNSSWTLNSGYTNDDLNSFPWPIISQQFDALRIILMTTDTDADYVCQGSLQGFKVYFHQPNEFPKTFGKHVFVPLEQEATIGVEATMAIASADLLRYKPELRECYQSHEKKLKFFRTYTKQNCEIESMADFALKNCSCVRFSMPREKHSKLCGIQQLDCLTSAERHWLSTTTGRNVKNSKCLPSCTEINYEVKQLSMTNFEYEALFDSYSYDLSDIPG